MERLNRTSPFAIPRTRTGDLTQPTAPTASPASNPKPPREATYKPAEMAQREALIGEASQRDYGDMPWAEAPGRMTPEQRQAVIDQHKDDPCLVEQASGFTCAATTIQRWMACNDKPNYERMVNELMDTGTTKLPNGDAVSISPENQAFLDSLNLPPERHVNAVVQTALMDYANGEAGFDIKTGKGTDGRIGLARHEAQTLFEKVTGNHTQFVGDLSSYESREAFLQELQTRMDRGNYVCVPLNLSEVQARAAALEHSQSSHQAQLEMRFSDGYGDGMDGQPNAMEQWEQENAALWQEAEAAGVMAHLVEVSSINEDGTISAYDPARKGFVTLSKEEFFEAMDAAKEDHVGGTLGYYTTSTYLKPTYTAPTYTTTTYKAPTYTTTSGGG